MKKILIACQYATNKGDRAIAEYLLYQLQKQEDVQVTLSTNCPELWDSLAEKGVRVIGMGYTNPSRLMKPGIFKKIVSRGNKLIYKHAVFQDLIKENGKHNLCKLLSGNFIREVQEADLVIVTGGHHITSIRSKNALFDVTYDIGLIHLFSKRYVLWSQTIGPLVFSNDRAKAFFGEVLQGAEAVYIRDDNSRKCLDELYPDLSNVRKSYDSVFGFGELETIPYDQRQKKVGISIFNGLKKAYGTFDAIAEVLNSFMEKGYAVEFFRMEHYEKEEQDIQSIIDRLRVKSKASVYPFKTSTLDHLREMSTCSHYIGYKTHSVIMALTTATPLIGICYHQKTRDFMADYELAKYAIDDTTFTAQEGIARMAELEEHGEKIHAKMKEQSIRIAEVIAKDFCDFLKDGGSNGGA